MNKLLIVLVFLLLLGCTNKYQIYILDILEYENGQGQIFWLTVYKDDKGKILFSDNLNLHKIAQHYRYIEVTENPYIITQYEGVE